MFDIEDGEIFGYAEIEVDFDKCLKALLICYDTDSHSQLEGYIKMIHDQYTEPEPKE